MKSVRQTLLLSIGAFLLVLGLRLLLAEGTAEGTLRIDDSDTVAYAGPDDIILVITDRPLQNNQVPFGIYDLAVEDKVRGIVFSISQETRGLARGGRRVEKEARKAQPRRK